jgi:hypothetical protein
MTVGSSATTVVARALGALVLGGLRLVRDDVDR